MNFHDFSCNLFESGKTAIMNMIAIIPALVLCMFVGIFLSHPLDFPAALEDACRSYHNDFLVGCAICAPAFLLVTYLFRNQNKLLLAAINIPSAIFGFYLIATAMMGDDSISSYGYLLSDQLLPCNW